MKCLQKENWVDGKIKTNETKFYEPSKADRKVNFNIIINQNLLKP